MSWFSSSSTSNKQSTSSTSSSPSSSPSSSDYKPLDRTERQACWEARDGYFSCLDKHNILDAIKDADAAKKSCGPENEVYERDCAKSWVSLLFCGLWCGDGDGVARDSFGF